MTLFDHFLLRFLLASAGCMVAGVGVAMLIALARRLPGLALQRSTWLLGQLTLAAAFLVILLPHSERLRLVPPIEIDGTTLAGVHSAAPTPNLALAASGAAVLAWPVSQQSWLLYAARAWLLVYLFGFAYAIFSLFHGWRVLCALAKSGSQIHALWEHDGFCAVYKVAPELAVIEVDAPISPMLFGIFRPRLLLPLHLRSFDSLQQQLIVEHELTHLRRRDLHWMSAGLVLETLLWFNPVMRVLRTQLSWAQELGCDRDVLASRPRVQRKAYASALVGQLKMQHGPLKAALAFGGVTATTLAARIALIREPVRATCSRRARVAAAGALGLVLLGSLAFQPSLVWHSAAAAVLPLSCTAISDAASGARLAHEGQCDERVTPASTFNIAVSLMGYDSGVLEDEHTPVLPFKPGYPDWNPTWRQSTDPSSWISNSVLWFAQQIAVRLGAERFQRYVQQFKYGNQDVSGDPGKDNGMTLSWVSSSLTISPAEQVTFLRKVVNRQLPLSPHSYDMTSRIMTSEVLPNGWQVHGKTGTAAHVLPSGEDDEAHQYGWYVGWAKKGDRTVVFARLVLLKREENNHAGWRVRQVFLRQLPSRLDAL
jgi:beta-lactamase class D/beta-lactamase regulating signal transducer with metallopeptidase domain